MEPFVLFSDEVDPTDMNISAMIDSAPASKGPLFSELKYARHSDCARYVRFCVNRLNQLMNDRVFTSFPLEIQQKIGNRLDQYWLLVQQMIEQETRLGALDSISVDVYRAFTDKEWLKKGFLDGRRVPSSANMDCRAASTLREFFTTMITSYNSPSQTQEDRYPLVAIFRRAWMQRQRFDAWVSKFDSILASTSGKREKKGKSARTEEAITRGSIREYCPGKLVLRHYLQWWCLFHIGAYPHCQHVTRSALDRKAHCLLWISINDLTNEQLDAQASVITNQSVISLCVVKEFMHHAIRTDLSLYDFTKEIPNWTAFDELFLQFCDNYRKTLPYTPVAASVIHDHLQAFEVGRKFLRKAAKLERRQKRDIRVSKDIERKKRKKAKDEGLEYNDDEDKSGDDEDEDDDDDMPTLTAAPLLLLKENVKLLEKLEKDAKSQNYDEGKDFEEKTEKFDEEFVHTFNRICKNPALTQLFIFTRCVDEVGASARTPEDMWKFLHKNMVYECVKHLDLSTREIVFDSTIRPLQHGYEMYRGEKLDFDACREIVVQHFEEQWKLTTDTTPIEALGEHLALKGVEAPLQVAFLTMRRFVIFIMTAFHCDLKAQEDITFLIGLHYHSSRCGKPTLQSILRRLARETPYEYAIFCVMIAAWKEWSSAFRIKLPHHVVENQILEAQRHFGNMPINPRFDWFLYCRVCGIIRTPIDQCTAVGNAVPHRYVGHSISGFHEVYVDVKGHYENEEDRPFSCPRKSGRLYPYCSVTPMNHMKMLGFVVIFNGKAYSVCCQRGCSNRMECFTGIDKSNRAGFMCASCVSNRAFRDECDRDLDAALEAQATSKTPLRTRRIKLANGEETEVIVSKTEQVPASSSSSSGSAAAATSIRPHQPRKGAAKTVYYDANGVEIVGQQNILNHCKKIKEEQIAVKAELTAEQATQMDLYGTPVTRWVPDHIKRGAANYVAKRPRGRPPKAKATASASTASAADTTGDNTLPANEGAMFRLGELNSLLARTRKYTL